MGSLNIVGPSDVTLDELLQAGGGGVQYADGDTAATPTGTAVAWNDGGTERIASATKPLPVETPAITSTNNIATGQVALSTSAAQVIAARALRQCVTIRNHDLAITIYLGATGVTSATGIKLLPGESMTLDTQAAVFAVAASGTPTAAYLEEYGS